MMMQQKMVRPPLYIEKNNMMGPNGMVRKPHEIN